MNYQQLWHSLSDEYGEREARAVVSWLLEVVFGLSQTDVVCGAVNQMQDGDRIRLQAMMTRLQQGEPVQYVAGTADFGPRQFSVAPCVLIPRPETYELCRWIVESGEWRVERNISVLDIGTGSGCIATTLALDLPGAQVTAWDISEEALRIAQTNADRHAAGVLFQLQDALNPPADRELWDVIVSNPPYVCECERQAMERHVLDHEPALALFVPDNDPLRFYRAIGNYARKALKPNGRLFFELNATHAGETADMLRQQGFSDVTLREDQFGRTRFLRAARPSHTSPLT